VVSDRWGLFFEVPLSRLSKHEVIEVPVRCEQACQVLAGIKHPRLHGVLRNVENLGDVFDRLVVI
jgi:hypothetical protein